MPADPPDDRTLEQFGPPAGGRRSDAYPFLGPPARPSDLGTLGGYRVRDELGAGGMGVVFRAEDPKLRREVAVKVMRPEAAGNPLARDRFVREARAQAAVEHDHIIPIHQVDDGAVPFLVMPLLKGRTLAAALKDDPHPPPAEVCRIGRQIADGLAAAHERGLIHRDIKPGNVWLEGSRRRVKILDFGLARAADDAPEVAAGSVVGHGSGTDLTRTGGVLGTPAYMAPEQAAGQPVDHRADLFSLGVVLYQMAAGRLPFAGATVLELMANVIAAPAPPLVGVPAPLADLIGRLLSKPPADRPGSAAAVADALRAAERVIAPPPPRPVSIPEVWAAVAADTEETPVPPILREPKPARRAWAAWAAVVVLLGAAAVGWLVIAKRPVGSPVAGRSDKPKESPPPPATPARPPADFHDTRGRTEEELVVWVKGLPPGYGPVCVAPRAGADPPRFDAVAVPAPGLADWTLLFVPLGSDEGTEANDQMRASNRRPVGRFAYLKDGAAWAGRVEARPTGAADAPAWPGGPRTADLIGQQALYARGRVAADRLAQVRAKGRWPAALSGVRLPAAGGVRETVLFRSTQDAGEWEVARDLSADGLTRAAADARAKGRWPAVLTAVGGVAPPQFLAVFAANTAGREWELVVQQPEAEYAAGLPARRADGWTPHALNGATGDGTTRFTVVWTRGP